MDGIIIQQFWLGRNWDPLKIHTGERYFPLWFFRLIFRIKLLSSPLDNAHLLW